MAALEAGSRAPGFRLPDRDGGADRSPSWDKLTLLAFYKVTCPTCMLALPYVERYAAYADAGLNVLGVVEDPADAAQAFAEEYGIQADTALDPKPYAVSSAYGLTNVPTLFLVEPGGRIVDNAVGFSKDGYNGISEEIAQRLGVEAREICPPDDGAPAFKPG